MDFLELALYGFRNFKSLTRFNFKPGLNLVQGENGSGKTAIQEAIFLILSPEKSVSPSGLKPPGATGDCQAGLVMKIQNGRIIRIVRDFTENKINLSELGAEKKFQVMMTKPEEIAVFLSEQIGGIPSRNLQDIFLITPHTMPSSRVAPSPRSKSHGSLPKKMDSNTPLPGTKDHAKKTDRLAELKKQLEQADLLSKLEDDLANTQSLRAEVSRRVRIVKEKTEEISELDHQFGNIKKIGDLPGDYHLVIESTEQQEEVKADTISSLTEEMEYSQQEIELIPGEPFFTNKLFIGGGATTLIAILVGVFLTLTPLIQNLLLIPLLAGFGLMGYIGFLDFLKSNKKKNLEKKIQDSQWKIHRVEREFKRDNEKIIELLEQMSCPDIPVLKEKIREYEGYLQQRKLLESEQKQYLEEKNIGELEREFEKLKTTITTIEEELRQSTTLSSDIYLMQEEYRKLEKQLSEAKIEQSSTGGPPKDKAVDEGGEKPIPETENELPDLLSPDLQEGLKIPSVKTFLFTRLSESLTIIRKFIENIGGPIDKDIELTENLSPVLSNKQKNSIPWDTLSGGQRDLFHLATQLGLIQVLGSAYPFPIILDNPLTTLDPRRQKATLDILKEISQNRQIIYLSSGPCMENSDANRIILR